MVEALINGLIHFLLFIINVIGSIFFYPIQAIVVSIIPSVGDFLGTISSFFSDSIFPLICFLKNLILNITCCPPALFGILVAQFFLYLTVAVSIRVYLLIFRVYLLARGSKG